jgi:hypothetical protein
MIRKTVSGGEVYIPLNSKILEILKRRKRIFFSFVRINWFTNQK